MTFNTYVCHHQKGGDCWNKYGLNNHLIGFDDNKVLKDQLVLLTSYSSVQD
jgi:hypothetical protein